MAEIGLLRSPCLDRAVRGEENHHVRFELDHGPDGALMSGLLLVRRDSVHPVPTGELTEPRRVMLRGPADRAFVRVARTATLSIASQAGLAVDPCDELRIAVDESCNALIDAGADSLAIEFVDDGTELVVDLRTTLRQPVELSATAQLVLSTMVDDLQADLPGRIVLHKQLA